MSLGFSRWISLGVLLVLVPGCAAPILGPGPRGGTQEEAAVALAAGLIQSVQPSPVPSSAASPDEEISGTCFEAPADPSIKNPIYCGSAILALLDHQNREIKTTRTGENGKFVFSGISKKGKYHVVPYGVYWTIADPKKAKVIHGSKNEIVLEHR